MSPATDDLLDVMLTGKLDGDGDFLCSGDPSNGTLQANLFSLVIAARWKC